LSPLKILRLCCDNRNKNPLYSGMRKNTLLVFLVAFYFVACAQKNENYLLIGTYTNGKSEGVYVYRFNSETGDFDSVSMIKTSNPSYLAISPDEKFVYAVNEGADKGNGGRITAFAFNKTDGTLSLIDQQPSAGDDPCYVSVDKTNKWITIANYTSGTLSVLPIKANGGLDQATTVIQQTGYSVNTDRQTSPHMHCAIFSKDNKYLFAADLGTDKVMAYSFDEKTGKLAEAASPFVMTKAGAGPRHLTFHPNNKFAYLIEELTGTISVYSYKNGAFALLQNASALPPDYMGEIGSADIHVSADGKFLYASNRGESNTIAIYKIDQKNGSITLIGHQSTLGKTPRNFNFDPSGNFLLVANQNTDDIVIFKVDKKTGLLSDSGKRINAGNPVCIKWISEK
jgi:6-phosphogluconolactonase